jgi:hypothetical protein
MGIAAARAVLSDRSPADLADLDAGPGLHEAAAFTA